MQKSGEDEQTVDVFFYGLFMDVDALREKAFHPIRPRRAVVSDMALRIGDRATLSHCDGSLAYGVVMALLEPEIDKLYSDPSVSAYQPELVVAICEDGTAVTARCYNLPEGTAAAPNPEYATKLALVAEKVGLSESYVRSLRAMAKI